VDTSSGDLDIEREPTHRTSTLIKRLSHAADSDDDNGGAAAEAGARANGATSATTSGKRPSGESVGVCM